MFAISSMIDFSSSSDWIATGSMISSTTLGQLDRETKPEFPSFSHISSAMYGANGDNIATRLVFISYKTPEYSLLFFAFTLLRYHCKSPSNEKRKRKEVTIQES